MKISQSQATPSSWNHVKSWNYKLKGLNEKYQSVVLAELDGDHGAVDSTDLERVYFIIDGTGEFIINNEVTPVEAGDVITVPGNVNYDYKPTPGTKIKVLLFMELWDN